MMSRDIRKYAGLKVFFATAVLLAPVIIKSAFTVVMKIRSKRQESAL